MIKELKDQTAFHLLRNKLQLENSCHFAPNGGKQKPLREDPETPEGTIAVTNVSLCATAM